MPIDRAHLLMLTAPEMTVMIVGLRALAAADAPDDADPAFVKAFVVVRTKVMNLGRFDLARCVGCRPVSGHRGRAPVS